MTIAERAVELLPQDGCVGLGSGRAAQAFVRALGERVRAGALRVRGVPTSEETAAVAREVGIALATLAEAPVIDLTVDGADEVDPRLELIKGYGRAMVREKVVAAASRRLVILVGEEKLVPQLGTRGRLPVEVIPFALPVAERRVRELGLAPALWARDGAPGTTDNGNYILDCGLDPIADPERLERDLRAIPGVVGTGLFLGMAEQVLVGTGPDLELVDEKRR
jgi:ribose 5-phosphate isomerase A